MYKIINIYKVLDFLCTLENESNISYFKSDFILKTVLFLTKLKNKRVKK